jgi:hypothetical protein
MAKVSQTLDGSHYHLTDDEYKESALYNPFLIIQKSLIPDFGLETAAYISWLRDRYHFFREMGQLRSDDSFWVMNEQVQGDLGISTESVRKVKRTCVNLGIIVLLGQRRLTIKDSLEYVGTVKEFLRFQPYMK